jgi:hypothetical protein
MICDNIEEVPSPSRYPPGDNLTTVEYGMYQETDQDGMADSGIATFVHRPKVTQPATISEESDVESSEDNHGFTLVSRPKPPALATPDEPRSSPELLSPIADILAANETDFSSNDDPMSSPELIPTPVVDILAATGTDYSSDEEWIEI